jgi:MOSC domain-containing protein YiiM
VGLLEPHGRYRERDGEAALGIENVTGRLLGIARHKQPRGPMESLAEAQITIEGGVSGDCRGVLKPGGRGRRQVTLISAESWDEAVAELGTPISWEQRRANLLVSGLKLEISTGARIRIGDAVLEITGECDPCSRMEELAPGLKAALTRHWRGGATARVVSEGSIAIGDEVRIETV